MTANICTQRGGGGGLTYHYWLILSLGICQVWGGALRDVVNDENEVIKPEVRRPVRLPTATPSAFEAYYYELYGDITNSESGQIGRQGSATSTHSCAFVRDVPSELRSETNIRPRGISNFYQKYTEAYGIPVVGSADVDDLALSRACYVLRFLLAGREDLREGYYKAYGRVSIIAPREDITQIPEYSFLPVQYDEGTRGLGAIPLAPVSTAGEENSLCYNNDTYKREDILIREIAEGIFHLVAVQGDPGLRDELQAMYEGAISKRLWRNTYAHHTADSYLGEGVQSYFSVNGYADPPNGVHNYVNTRTKLGSYDPPLYRFVERLFPCANNYLKRCRSRGNEHLQVLQMDCGHRWGPRRRSHSHRSRSRNRMGV